MNKKARVHWAFSLNDNPSLTNECSQQIYSHFFESKMHLHSFCVVPENALLTDLLVNGYFGVVNGRLKSA